MNGMIEKKEPKPDLLPSIINIQNKSKFEVYGEEMIEKEVKQSGNSGRVYLPPEWVGKRVKIIRID
jgi:putative transposon-encoded protein